MKKRTKIGLLSLLAAAFSTVVLGQSFTTFVNERVTTQLDLQGTLTANGSTGTTGQVLTSNGASDIAWTTPATGSVTSVALTVPSGLSVTGSPITTSGTLAISTTLNGVLRGTGSGFATAASSDVIGLWSGTCNSTTFLRADGSCQAVVSTPGGSDTQVQFNDAGAFGGDAGMTYNKTTDNLTVGLLNSIAPSDFARLSQANTFTAKNTFTGISSGASAGGFTANLESTTPGLQWLETDGSATNQIWQMFAGGEQFVFRLGEGVSQSILTVDRTAGAVDTINFANGTLQSGGNLVPNVTSAPTWTGIHTFSGSPTVFNSTAPFFRFNESDEGTNEKRWLVGPFTGSFIIGSENDGGGGGANALVIARTGTTMDSITLSATTVTADSADLFHTGRQFSAGGASNQSTAIQLCHAGSGYAVVGSNVVCTTTGNQYNYGINDVAWLLDFENQGSGKLTFRRAAAGTGTISFSDLGSIGPGGWTVNNVNASGNTLTVTQSGTARILLNDTGGAGNSLVVFSDAGTTRGIVGSSNAAGQCISGDAAGDLCIRGDAGTIRFSTDGGSSTAATINSSKVLNAIGGLQVNGTNACLSDGTNCSGGAVTTGSYTGAVSGCTTDPAPSISYAKFGPIVVITIPAFSCTSNSTAFSVSGAPSTIRPASASGGTMMMPFATNNGTNSVGTSTAAMSSAGVLSFGIGAPSGQLSAWVSSGTKGVFLSTMTYSTL